MSGATHFGALDYAFRCLDVGDEEEFQLQQSDDPWDHEVDRQEISAELRARGAPPRVVARFLTLWIGFQKSLRDISSGVGVGLVNADEIHKLLRPYVYMRKLHVTDAGAWEDALFAERHG